MISNLKGLGQAAFGSCTADLITQFSFLTLLLLRDCLFRSLCLILKVTPRQVVCIVKGRCSLFC
jgi:hypothetical protein